MYLSYCIQNTDSYQTIKEVLKSYFHISDRLLLKLKKQNKVFLNHSPCPIYRPVHAGDIISFLLDFEEDNSNIIPCQMDLSIIYEDPFYLVIDKPANLATHPSISHYSNSLSNGIRFYFDQIGLKKKIRIVNRLDKNTSGLVLCAKNEYIQECLIQQMQKNQIQKEYIGILTGYLYEKSGTIDAPIARKSGSIIERCIDPNGERAITHYTVLQESDGLSLVKFRLETGRTHQIRVHSSYIGHPILGDSLYGTESSLISRQALHSYHLSFYHPVNKQFVEYTSPLPKDMLFLF